MGSKHFSCNAFFFGIAVLHLSCHRVQQCLCAVVATFSSCSHDRYADHGSRRFHLLSGGVRRRVQQVRQDQKGRRRRKPKKSRKS